VKAKKLPRILSASERELLLSLPNPRYVTGIRNQAIIHTLLTTGLRAAELTALRRRDIDLETGEVRVVHGKGGRDRNIITTAKTVSAIRGWLERAPESEYVFCTAEGGQLSTSYLRQMMLRYGRRLGFDFSLHPHTLRHTYASMLYKATKDLTVVQRLLGHASLQSTLIYTHLVDPNGAETVEAFTGLTGL